MVSVGLRKNPIEKCEKQNITSTWAEIKPEGESWIPEVYTSKFDSSLLKSEGKSVFVNNYISHNLDCSSYLKDSNFTNSVFMTNLIADFDANCKDKTNCTIKAGNPTDMPNKCYNQLSKMRIF